jgi:adenylate cyclase class IV
MIEVELKFELAPGCFEQLQARFAAMPAVQRVGQVDSTDIYYDTAHYDCLQRAIFIRIRNQRRVEIKFHEEADPNHTHSTERVFPLRAKPEQMQEFNILCAHLLPLWHSAETIEQALQLNGLEAFVPIEKQRMVYTCQDMTLCLDCVGGLGNFLEIEVLCEDHEEHARAAEIEIVMAHLQQFIAELRLPAQEPVPVGYVELWLRQHRPEVYRLGKYQIETKPEAGRTVATH